VDCYKLGGWCGFRAIPLFLKVGQMSGQGDHLKASLILAGFISCAAPLSSSAMLLGEASLHTFLGQPLRVTIPLTAGSDEELDSRCFSLARPKGQGEHASYLTQASLELLDSNGRLELKIHSTQVINEPVLHLLVQGSCGQAHLSREYTLLLDPVDYAQIHFPAVKPAAASSGMRVSKTQDQQVWAVRHGETLHSIAGSLYPRQKKKQRDLLRAIREANPELHGMAVDEPLPEGGVIRVPAPRPLASASAPSTDAASKPRRVRVSAKTAEVTGAQPQAYPPAIQEGGFRLKLSTSDLDLSAIGQITEERRQQLREKQLLLDADDQVANALSMKNRIMQLEEQLQNMRQELEKTNSRLSLSEKLATPPVQNVVSTSASTNTNQESWWENTSLRGMAGVGLIVAFIVSGWWRWRRRQAEAWLDAELGQEFAPSEMPQYVKPAQSRPEEHRAGKVKPSATDLEEDFLLNPTSIFEKEDESVTFTEAESVLDEVDLYLAYGWANRAIESLQEYLDKHPDDVHLWKKLFEIYSSQGMKAEFEQLALRCQSNMDDSSLWVLVQKLGRQLDADNPLYFASHEESEITAPEMAPEAPAVQDEEARQDTPLDFVLDTEQAQQPGDGEASNHLEFDPLFPEPSKSGKDDKTTG
jgi:Tfp pilus assembly protein FimV